MNKKVLIFGLFIVILASFAFAGECNPDGGYNYCFNNQQSESVSNGASSYQFTAKAEIQTGQIYSYNIDGKKYAVSVEREEKYVDITCEGTEFYLFDVQEENFVCTGEGCTGNQVARFDTNKNVKIALDDYAPIKPALVCFSRVDESFGAFAWTFAFAKWDTTYLKVQRECTASSQCSQTEFCSVKNWADQQCQALTCTGNQVIKNHKCVAPSIPEYCQDAGIGNLDQCYAYLDEYLSILTGSLDEKVDQINEMELLIDEKISIIQKLNLNLEEQTQVINRLEATIEEKAQIIQTLQDNINDQVAVIEKLELKTEELAEMIAILTEKTEEQAAIINRLAENVDKKAALIELLQVENEKQAELLVQMRVSFSEQGQILDRMNNTIQEDAQLIHQLTITNQEKGEIIANMRLNIEEQQELIIELQRLLEEEREQTARYKFLLEEQKEDVATLEALIAQEKQDVANLRTIVERQQEILNQNKWLIRGLWLTLGVVLAGFAFIIMRRKKK
jgi:hypothetical protein